MSRTFRNGPKMRFLRNPRVLNERKGLEPSDDLEPRKRAKRGNIPDAWDDIPISGSQEPAFQKYGKKRKKGLDF